MAKKTYIGINGKAQNVKKWYLGDTDKKARRVKKGYIGVAGVARPFMDDGSNGEIVSYGSITSLSDDLGFDLAATTVGDYAIFAGGASSAYLDSTTKSKKVNVYNSELVKSAANELSIARQDLAATTVGNYALFGGGYSGAYRSNVDKYDSNLVSGKATALSEGRHSLAATTVGDYAIFGGGQTLSKTTNLTDVYDSNLTKGTIATLGSSRNQLAATTVGDYAIFGGGNYAGHKNNVDAYTSSLVKIGINELSVARHSLAATTVGNYALFGGGTGLSAVVDVYNSYNLVRSNAPDLSVARKDLAATTVGNYALFGGGTEDAYYTTVDSIVDVYDSNLVKSVTTDLSVARTNLAATTVGKYALFGGGGISRNNGSGVVDAYMFTGDLGSVTPSIPENPDGLPTSLSWFVSSSVGTSSGSSIESVSDNGLNITFTSGNRETPVLCSDYIYLPAGTTVTFTPSSLTGSGTTVDTMLMHIYDMGGNEVTVGDIRNSIQNPITLTVDTSANYQLRLSGYSLTVVGSQTGTTSTYYSVTVSGTISFSK